MYFLEYNGKFYRFLSDVDLRKMVEHNGSRSMRVYKQVKAACPGVYGKLYGEYDGLGRYYLYEGEEVKIAEFNII